MPGRQRRNRERETRWSELRSERRRHVRPVGPIDGRAEVNPRPVCRRASTRSHRAVCYRRAAHHQHRIRRPPICRREGIWFSRPPIRRDRHRVHVHAIDPRPAPRPADLAQVRRPSAHDERRREIRASHRRLDTDARVRRQTVSDARDQPSEGRLELRVLDTAARIPEVRIVPHPWLEQCRAVPFDDRHFRVVKRGLRGLTAGGIGDAWVPLDNAPAAIALRDPRRNVRQRDRLPRPEVHVERRERHRAVGRDVRRPPRTHRAVPAFVGRLGRAVEQIVRRDLVRVPALGGHRRARVRVGGRGNPLRELDVVPLDQRLLEEHPQPPPGRDGAVLGHARRIESARNRARQPLESWRRVGRERDRARVARLPRVLEAPVEVEEIPGRERRAEIAVERVAVAVRVVGRREVAAVARATRVALAVEGLARRVEAAEADPVAELGDRERRIVRVDISSRADSERQLLLTVASGRDQDVRVEAHAIGEHLAQFADVGLLHALLFAGVARERPPAARDLVRGEPLHAAHVLGFRGCLDRVVAFADGRDDREGDGRVRRPGLGDVVVDLPDRAAERGPDSGRVVHVDVPVIHRHEHVDGESESDVGSLWTEARPHVGEFGRDRAGGRAREREPVGEDVRDVVAVDRLGGRRPCRRAQQPHQDQRQDARRPA